ncbi:uncharacterized protein PHALS_02572 [Plasmopara halstedii]|uniref:Uncharacterized protein n=1 Tax=Plasmopara halstedii TaxID=4781 RepID=A0A0P1AX56_PLAHL|nr:uncharacterized protein PHALS_02572 [Plasmopara halstedii]CEG46153.1 hypothetical protein PHALS_02572 [Plasmopara halstedii]|eukprot:XP_024582522.1 hypothetical protein PHALS_02572 [Plasmopara halstedii]
MTDRLIHNRVFKVSKELNQVDVLCEQHRRHISNRQGLPNWNMPMTPAGKTSCHHERTPAFFAWNEEPEERSRPTWQTDTPQKVARTLHLTPVKDRQPVAENSPDLFREENAALKRRIDNLDEESAIEANSDSCLVEKEDLSPTERLVTKNPVREDIVDRTSYAASASSIEIAPTSRYQQLHQVASATATPKSQFRDIAAGLSTEKADRYRMSRSSGKRFRSPVRTSLWEHCNDKYIHQDIGGYKDATNLSHKRITPSTAARTFDSSAVSQALNMTPIRSQMTGQDRRPIRTGSEPSDFSTSASREFVHDDEWKQSELPQLDTINSTKNTSLLANKEYGHRAGKRVSFNGETARPQPQMLPVLADKTTQTDESLWPPRTDTTLLSSDIRIPDTDASVRCSACKKDFNHLERPQKVPRHSIAAQQPNFRRSSSHLTNPILMNPRYPPEPKTFQKRSTSSSLFNDRLAWR